MNDINLGKVPCHTCLLICEGCIERQQLKAAFPIDRGRQANKPMDIAHSEVFLRLQNVVHSGGDFQMRPSGRNAAPIVVGVAESSKSPTINLGENIEEHEDRLGDNQGGIQAPKED